MLTHILTELKGEMGELECETKEKAPMTRRQMNILKCMAKGSTNESIANELGISVNTVKYHKKRIYEHLGAVSASQAVAIALSKKYI